MSMSRRGLLSVSAAGLAFAGFSRYARAQDAPPAPVDVEADAYTSEVRGYGPLKRDPAGLFDLPEGFTYTIVSRQGETMDDGLFTPFKTDGMGCFGLDKDRVILVRNHELKPRDIERTAFGPGRALASKVDAAKIYDTDDENLPMPGGTTTIVYDLKTRRRESVHLSLAGTSTNCAGGRTPWNSWLSCEEVVQSAGMECKKDHGYVFEVPAAAKGLVDPVPLKAMGRFRHEAAAVDPRSGVVYLTEDMGDGQGLFYRYLPNDRQALVKGGRLQALGFADEAMLADSRNWEDVVWKAGDRRKVKWIDLDGVDNPYEDLRWRGHNAGAAWFARGEGVFMADGDLYFACTNGGPGKLGQIMRYRPSGQEGQAGEADQPGELELYVESTNPLVMDMCDNIAVSPWGHLFVCEDKIGGVNYLRAITPEGRIYTVGRNAQAGAGDVGVNAELAGICFSPDGTTMFVNVYYPGQTLAITGPWSRFRR